MKSINIVVLGGSQTGKTTLCKAMAQKTEQDEWDMPIHSFRYGDANITLFDTMGDPMDMKTSLWGCYEANTVLLTVAADQGVTLQTAEKIVLAHMFNLNQGFILITKSDTATPDEIEAIKQKIKAFVKGTSLENLEIVEVSAMSGEGIPELRQKLSELEEPKANENGDFRFDVVYAYEERGRGIARGVVKRGKLDSHGEVQLMPWGKAFPVDHLLFADKEADEVKAGQMVGIAIKGVFPWDMPTGTIFCKKDTLKSSKEIEVELDVHPFYKEPIKVGQELHVCIGLQWNKVEVKEVEGEFKPGAKLKLKLEALDTKYPLAYEPNEEFILTRPDLSIRSFRICGRCKILNP